MENFPKNNTEIIPVPEQQLEKSANYEGNHFLLLIERLNNPQIFERLVNDIYEDQTTVDHSKSDYVNPDYLEYLNQGEEKIKKDIEKELKEAFASTSHSTEIIFSERGWLNSSNGSEGTGQVGISLTEDSLFKETEHLKNIAEAHEKGHVIRNYDTDSDFTKKLQSVFDFNLFNPNKEDLEFIKSSLTGEEDFSDEKLTELIKEYFNFPWEIIERMSQIKNYFGMSGTEKFTQEHLDYVRENYIKDTGMINFQIKPFFDSIVDDEKFIKFMNTLGI